MSESIEDLRALSDEELVKRHDENAKATVVGTKHYLDELSRRDNSRINKSMLHYTKLVFIMTAVMLFCTLTNILIAILR